MHQLPLVDDADVSSVINLRLIIQKNKKRGGYSVYHGVRSEMRILKKSPRELTADLMGTFT